MALSLLASIHSVYSGVNACENGYHTRLISDYPSASATLRFSGSVICEMPLQSLYLALKPYYTSIANHHLYAVVKKEWGTKGYKGSTMMLAL